MKYFDQYESSEFQMEDLLRVKKNRRIFVVFSTFGEREAALLHDKIRLLKKECSNYIDEIIISHRRTGVDEDETERNARSAWGRVKILVCNSYQVPDMGEERGKGADMRRALHYINRECRGDSDERDVIVVFLDADVVAEFFGTHFVMGLSGAVLRGHDFARASFWRKMGRIKKFVAQPLFSVIDHPELNNLAGFHYPLSGEVAGTLEFFNSVHFWQMYGVETGINVDTCMGQYRTADVNLGLYDHEHHTDLDVQKMAFGIIRTYLMQLCNYGIITLSDNARISDVFAVSYIDERGERWQFRFDLAEKKYPPMKEIL